MPRANGATSASPPQPLSGVRWTNKITGKQRKRAEAQALLVKQTQAAQAATASVDTAVTTVFTSNTVPTSNQSTSLKNAVVLATGAQTTTTTSSTTQSSAESTKQAQNKSPFPPALIIPFAPAMISPLPKAAIRSASPEPSPRQADSAPSSPSAKAQSNLSSPISKTESEANSTRAEESEVEPSSAHDEESEAELSSPSVKAQSAPSSPSAKSEADPSSAHDEESEAELSSSVKAQSAPSSPLAESEEEAPPSPVAKANAFSSRSEFGFDSDSSPIAKSQSAPSSPRAEDMPLLSPRRSVTAEVAVALHSVALPLLQSVENQVPDSLESDSPSHQALLSKQQPNPIQEVLMQGLPALDVTASVQESTQVLSPKNSPKGRAGAQGETEVTVHAAAQEVLSSPKALSSPSSSSSSSEQLLNNTSLLTPTLTRQEPITPAPQERESAVVQGPATEDAEQVETLADDVKLQDTLAEVKEDCSTVVARATKENAEQLRDFNKLHKEVLGYNASLDTLNSKLGAFQAKVGSMVTTVFSPNYKWDAKDTITLKGYLATYKGLKAELDTLNEKATTAVKRLDDLNARFAGTINEKSLNLQELSLKVGFVIEQYLKIQDAWKVQETTWSNQRSSLDTGAKLLMTYDRTLTTFLNQLKGHTAVAKEKLEEEAAPAQKAAAAPAKGWSIFGWGTGTATTLEPKKAEQKGETKVAEEDAEPLSDNLAAIDAAQKEFLTAATKRTAAQLAEFNALHNQFLERSSLLRNIIQDSGAQQFSLNLDVEALVYMQTPCDESDLVTFKDHETEYNNLRDRILPLKAELEKDAATLAANAKRFSEEINPKSHSLGELALKVGFVSADYMDVQATWAKKKAEWLRETSHFSAGARQLGASNAEMTRLLEQLKGRVTPQKGFLESLLGAVTGGTDSAKPATKKEKEKVEATASV